MDKVMLANINPKHQADATVNQAPVSGTKYEWSSDGTTAKALGTLKNVRIISIMIQCTWTVQPTPLELHLTIDGQLLKWTKTDPANATDYYAVINDDDAPDAMAFETGSASKYRSFLLEGREVKIEAEITGGTVSNLFMRVKYAKW